MPWLVDAELRAVGQADRRQQAPALIGDLPGHLDPLTAQLGQGGVDVVAPQVQLGRLRVRVNPDVRRGAGQGANRG